MESSSNKLIRICLRSDADVIEKQVNGKTVYQTQWMVSQFIGLLQAVFANSSFYFTREDKIICEARYQNNQSDLGNEIYPIQSTVSKPFIHVPVITISSRISMLTGYDLANITQSNVASALNSIYLLQDEVYGLIGLFILLFSIFVALSSYLSFRCELLSLDIEDTIEPFNYHTLNRHSRRRVILRPGFIRRCTLRRVGQFILNQTNGPRIACLFATILAFYLSTFFCSNYSTSIIVERRPTILDSYEKLAEHANASVFFLDYGSKISDSFKNAPRSSVKGKIWKRYSQTSASKDTVSTVELMKVSAYYFLMRDRKYVMLGPKFFIQTAGSAICAFRGPGEMRHLHIVHDKSENEQVYGFAVSSHLKDDAYLRQRLRRLVEAAVLYRLNQRYSDFIYDSASNLLDSGEGMVKQRAVCFGQLEEDAHEQQPVSITYWVTFFQAALGILFISLIVLTLENLKQCLTRHSQERSKVISDTHETRNDWWKQIRTSYQYDDLAAPSQSSPNIVSFSSSFRSRSLRRK